MHDMFACVCGYTRCEWYVAVSKLLVCRARLITFQTRPLAGYQCSEAASTAKSEPHPCTLSGMYLANIQYVLALNLSFYSQERGCSIHLS